MAIVKTVMRVAVVGGLAVGVAVLVAGPDRVAALAGQARQAVNCVIDKNIKDPVALRAQLRSLEAEYPKRIGEVRSDLAELQAHLFDLERDQAVSRKVVDMAQTDLAEVTDMLGRAEAARTESPMAAISVRFDDRNYSLDQAYSRATQITNTVNVYSTRASEADRDIAYLKEQQKVLEELLSQLETERAQFQAQIWQLDGQIEMIARNDKLIDVIEKRQATIDKYSRYEAVSLEQITSRMEKIRSEQESRLKSLTSQSQGTNYEKRAKAMIDTENAARDVFKKSQSLAPVPTKTIEIAPGAGPQKSAGPNAAASSSLDHVALNKSRVE